MPYSIFGYVDQENFMAISFNTTAIPFNTTSVSVIDNIGKLYKTAIPLSDDTSADTAKAFAYSVAALAENKVAPANTIYLKNNDTENFMAS